MDANRIADEFCTAEPSGDGWDVIVWDASGNGRVVEAVSDKTDALNVARSIRHALVTWLES
jgi:hypothetical protein